MSLEYIRQGKTAAETQELLKNTLMLSKLGNMETTDATEKLTAIMNGFQLKVAETGAVVDKLVALDNAYATSVNEISTAMQYSSNSAQQAGVDFDHLAAYITVVSSTTRQSSETIGQAFKTMFARMTDIKAGKIDEDGLGINNVETALARVNISLRDSKNQFRDMQDVIAELGTKWGTLSQIEQDNIAKSIAGVRQKEQFLVLMNNQAKIQEAINKEETAGGLAQERYQIYLQSVEAAQNRLTASWEAFVSSGSTRSFITSFYNGVTAILDTINALGGIPTILKVVIPLLIAYNLEWVKNRELEIAKFIGGIISSLQGFVTNVVAGTTAVEGMNVAESGLVGVTDALAASEAAATLGLSLLVVAIISAIQKYNEFKEKQKETADSLKQTTQDIQANATSYTQYYSQVEDAAKKAGYQIDANGKLYRTGYHNLKDYSDGLSIVSKNTWDAVHGTEAFDESLRAQQHSLSETSTYIGAVANDYKTLADTIKDVSGDMKTVTDLMDKQATGKLTFTDIQSLSPEQMQAVSVENGQIKINTDLLKQNTLAKIDAYIQSAKQHNATQQEIDVLTAYRNEIVKTIPLSKDFVDTFQQMLDSTRTQISTSGQSVEKFNAMTDSLARANDEFKNGQIDATQYFNTLSSELGKADFKSMFAGNQKAADTFFSGMTLNAGEAFTQINSMFQAGKINISDYMNQLNQLVGIFGMLGNIVVSSGSQMGMTAEQIAKVKDSTDSLKNSATDMNKLQELNNLLVSMNNKELEFGTEKYNQYAQAVVNAAFKSGSSWTDMTGKVYTSAAQMYHDFTTTNGAMANFAGQVGNKTQNVIKNVLHNVATLLRALASSIKDFKGTIAVVPKQVGKSDFGINVGPVAIPFTLPQLTLDISGSSNLNFGAVSAALNSIANQTDAYADSGLSVGINAYVNPAPIQAGSAAANALSNALGGSAKSAKKTKDAVAELKKELDAAKKSAEDSLNAQLSAYKKLIDARKQLLDSMQQEHDYQEKIDQQNKNILDIQNQLAALQFDTSEEGMAQKAKLKDELAKAQKDLQDTQYKNSIDTQKAALDADYSAFQTKVEAAINAIKDINATSMKDFASQLAAILAGVGSPTDVSGAERTSPTSTTKPLSTGTRPSNTGILKPYHDGGIVGGVTIGSNEQFAKLLKGEVVAHPNDIDTFMKKTLPAIAQTSSNYKNGDVNIDMPIQVAGSLDKNVIPDLERIVNKAVEKINQSMLSRGWNRRADLFANG